MSISEECKAYEKYFQQLQKQTQNPNQGTAFPISKSRLVRYIKYRARNSNFAQYLTNLEQHPEHGQQWLEEINSDEDIKKLVDLTVNLWPRQAKQCQGSLIGVGNVYETPSFERRFGKYIRDKVNQEAMYRERVHVVEGKKSRGFIVADPATENNGDLGTSLDSPISLDQPSSSNTYFLSHSNLNASSKSTFTPTASTSKHKPSDKHSTISTFKTRPISKYDLIMEEEALREELIQQIRLPSRAKLVSQFKPKSLNKTISPSSSSLLKSAKKEKQKLDFIAQKKQTITQNEELDAQIIHPIVQIEKPVFEEEPNLIEKELLAQIKHPIVQIKKITSGEEELEAQIKHPVVRIQTTSERELWKQAQTVRVIIRRVNGSNGKKGVTKIRRTSQAVFKVSKKSHISNDTTTFVKKPSVKHDIHHQRSRILRPANPKNRISPYNKLKNQRWQRSYDDDETEDQDDDHNSSRRKRQKKDYLFKQEKMQIVRVLVKNYSRF
ncbi:hypothetical protein BD408DRAFT_415312 [Parasitella parasitica]|nr:hypothetical protein BD408DRAFT_415312 [Parasitella parasitica]